MEESLISLFVCLLSKGKAVNVSHKKNWDVWYDTADGDLMFLNLEGQNGQRKGIVKGQWELIAHHLSTRATVLEYSR